MNNRGNFNLGDEIRNIVQDAVNNGNFNRLNRDITNFVNGALDEVKRSIDRSRENQTWNNQSWNSNGYQHNNYRESQTWNPNNKSNEYVSGYKQNKPVLKPENYAVPVGKVSGKLLTIFGSIGSSLFLLATIIMGIMGYSFQSNIMFNFIVFLFLPGLAASLILLFNGRVISNRLKRFQKYVQQMRGQNYFMIKDFSAYTGQSMKYTAKDLKKMIDIGMFPEGHIDDKKTCFMLNNHSYEQYLKLMENVRMREAEELKNKEESKNHESTNKDYIKSKVNLNPEIKKAIDEGRQYVLKIKEANIDIPGEEISRKLDSLEEVTGKIFDYVESHPEKFPEIKKFTEYFLPTTLKLLHAYREFECQPVQGENIKASKKEIEDTMDTINAAFENLLDSLFEDAAMDISTDISVLETMFAQEGLSKKNLK